MVIKVIFVSGCDFSATIINIILNYIYYSEPERVRGILFDQMTVDLNDQQNEFMSQE